MATRILPHMMKPSGWFQIGWSTDFPEASVTPMQWFGEDLVVFRTESGDLRALDGYCAHMGAHLGYGGQVCGDRVVCPFHGWEWDGEGHNVRIPYQDRPNRAARIRTWSVTERNGMVYLWHHPDGAEPTWRIPDVFESLGIDLDARSFHDPHPHGQLRFGRLPFDPYVVLDNGADPAHFQTVHQTKGIPAVVVSEPEGPLFRIKLGFGRRWVEDPLHARGDALDLLEVGVGVSFSSLGSDTSPHVVIVLSTTPVDETTSEMFQTVWLEEAEGDDEPGRLEQRMDEATHQLPRDIEIWSHQRYVERPAWAANEVRGFTALRRWASGFYASGSDVDAPAGP
jgi:nitrite reductase/ring-hydroxylating ferredoxin subunit